jgi:hypothetical protein
LQGASATNPVGTYLSAGLPNITGTFVNGGGQSGSLFAFSQYSVASGAFGLETISGSQKIMANASNAQSNTKKLTFNAGDSSAIYGNSTTVQSPAACVRFMIKY